MKGKINCDIKKLYVEATEKENEVMRARIKSGITDMIEVPSDGNIKSLENRLKKVLPKGERVVTNRELKMEKERFKEHEKLFKYLNDTSWEIYKTIEITTIPDDYLYTRLHWIQFQIARAFNELTFARRDKVKKSDTYNSGFNNSNYWDASKIRVIRKRIEREQGKAIKFNKSGKLSGYQNTVKAPEKLMAQLDPTGAAGKLMQDIQYHLENYRMEGFDYHKDLKEMLRDITKIITGKRIENYPDMPESELLEAATHLHNDLMHTQTRNIMFKDIPNEFSDFQKWRNSYVGNKFFELQKFRSERQQMGPDKDEYILVPLHSDKKGVDILRKQRNKDVVDNKYAEETRPSRNEEAYFAYKIPSNWSGFLKSIKSKTVLKKGDFVKYLSSPNMEDGFYTALDHKVSPYEVIDGTDKLKKKYSNFVRGVIYNDKIYQPPEEWMSQGGLWNIVERKRKFNETVRADLLEGKAQESQEEFSNVKNNLINILSESGLDDVEMNEILDSIEDIGLEDNYWKDNDGNWVNANSKFTAANRWSFDTVAFHPIENLKMMEGAIDGVSEEIAELQGTLTGYKNIKESEDSSLADKAEAREYIAEIEERLDELNEFFNQFNKKLFADDTDEGRRELKLANRILATKHRQLYTDNTRRRKDFGVHSESIDSINKNTSLTKIKTQAFKTFIGLRKNPSIIKYLANELKNIENSPSTEAGFFWINYSDEAIAWLISSIPGFDKEKYNAKWVKDTFLLIRGYKTHSNLGWGTGVGNQPQRISYMLTKGIEPFQRARTALKDGAHGFTAEEIWEQIEATGVLEPANAMIDMLTHGMDTSSSSLQESYLPLKDMVALWKNTTLDGWLASSKGWDKILAKAAGRSLSEKLTVEELKKTQDELKRIKTGLWEFFHEDSKNVKHLRKKLKDLKIGLSQGYINRAVHWRLHWFPLPGRNFWTLSGGERQMRAEAAYIEFDRMLGLGVVDTSKPGWKFTDSEETVYASRLSVYYHLFGMNSPHLSKMFRGGFGATFWQWKPYDYFQIQEEYRIFDNYITSIDSPITAPLYLTGHVIKKLLRAGLAGKSVYDNTTDKRLISGYQKFIKKIDSQYEGFKIDKKWDNKTLDNFTNLLLTRGLLSGVTLFAFYNSNLYGGWAILSRISKWSGLRNDVNQRFAFGGSSVLINRSIKGLMLLLLFLEKMGIGDSGLEEDEVVDDALRDYFPVIVSTIFALMKDWEENNWVSRTKALRPIIPAIAKPVIMSPEAGEIIEDVQDYFN